MGCQVNSPAEMNEPPEKLMWKKCLQRLYILERNLGWVAVMLLPKGTSFLCESDVFGAERLSMVFWWGLIPE